MSSAMRTLVILVRPTAFFANPVTMLDNHFQHATNQAEADTSAAAQAEHTGLAERLRSHGVTVGMVAAELKGAQHQPDAIFPNNSLSFHVTHSPSDAPSPLLTAYFYPMSPGRRLEVPAALGEGLAALATAFPDEFKLVDLRAFEDPATGAAAGLDVAQAPHGLVLEGTGALVFSHDATALYVGQSQRAYGSMVRHLSSSSKSYPGFQSPSLREVYLFTAKDREGRLIYHTNVVGWNGMRVAGWCLDALHFDEQEDVVVGSGVTYITKRSAFESSFAARGVTLLRLSYDEIEGFAGNALELFDDHGRPILTLSEAAWQALSPSNKAALVDAYGGEQFIVPSPIPTIERLGGGSVRCLQCHLNYETDPTGTPKAPAVARLLETVKRISVL